MSNFQYNFEPEVRVIPQPELLSPPRENLFRPYLDNVSSQPRDGLHIAYRRPNPDYFYQQELEREEESYKRHRSEEYYPDPTYHCPIHHCPLLVTPARYSDYYLYLHVRREMEMQALARLTQQSEEEIIDPGEENQFVQEVDYEGDLDDSDNSYDDVSDDDSDKENVPVDQRLNTSKAEINEADGAKNDGDCEN